MRVAGLILVTGAAAQSQVKKTWPDCLTKGYILKNNETNSIFADIRPLGASKGCWQDNCGSTDKTEVISLDHCAATCAKIPECNFWSVYDNICYFRETDDTQEHIDDAVFAPRDCAPEGTIFTVEVPHAQAALMAAQNQELLECAEKPETCGNVYGALSTFAFVLQQFKQAVLKGGPETLALLREQSGFADNALQELNLIIATEDPKNEEVSIVLHNAVSLVMEVSEWLAAQPAVPVDRSDLSQPLPILGYFCGRYSCYPPADLTAMPEFLALAQSYEQVTK